MMGSGRDGGNGRDGVDGADGRDGRDGRDGVERSSCEYCPIPGRVAHVELLARHTEAESGRVLAELRSLREDIRGHMDGFNTVMAEHARVLEGVQKSVEALYSAWRRGGTMP